jgi:hypothetical protein
VRFGAWHTLERAAETAPASPGVLQARADELLPFPRGKSAMVLYAASAEGETLAAFVAGAGAALLAAAQARGARWVRYAEAPRPTDELARLLHGFAERFGAQPPANT